MNRTFLELGILWEIGIRGQYCTWCWTNSFGFVWFLQESWKELQCSPYQVFVSLRSRLFLEMIRGISTYNWCCVVVFFLREPSISVLFKICLEFLRVGVWAWFSQFLNSSISILAHFFKFKNFWTYFKKQGPFACIHYLVFWAFQAFDWPYPHLSRCITSPSSPIVQQRTAGYPLVSPLVLVFFFSRILVLVLKTKNLILGSGSSSKNEPGSSFD